MRHAPGHFWLIEFKFQSNEARHPNAIGIAHVACCMLHAARGQLQVLLLFLQTPFELPL